MRDKPRPETGKLQDPPSSKNLAPSEVLLRRLREHNLQLKHIEGKGNCLFLAIIDQEKQIDPTKQKLSVPEVREMFVQAAISDWDNLRHFLDAKATKEDVLKYRKDKHWNDIRWEISVSMS